MEIISAVKVVLSLKLIQGEQPMVQGMKEN